MLALAGRSKGCAIIQYASIGDAQRAILELNNTMIQDRLIFVREDREGGFTGGDGSGYGARGGVARVYVGNLSWEVQWQDLKDHMRGPNQDLNVMHADVMVDATGPAALSVRAIATLPMSFALMPRALRQS